MNRIGLISVLVLACICSANAQRGRSGARVAVGIAPVALPDGPVVLDTAEQHKIRVKILARGLSHPWAMAWLPNGDLLVTERAGRLRIVRNVIRHDGGGRDAVLDPTPVSGLPPMHVRGLAGLLDIALHPKFAQPRKIPAHC